MAIKPGKYDPLKPDIELFDFKSKKRFGLKLEGSSALQVGTISQDDSVHIRGAGKRVGDFDEQRSWKGGRGIENLSENAEGFWDSQNAWTLSSGHLHQTLLWQFARGLRSCDFDMPSKTKSLTWKALIGTSKYVSISWSSSGFTADYARLWIRRIGTPGTLTFKLHSTSAGDPGTVLQTVTKTTSDITDFVSVLQLFDWTSTQALSASTTYHISVFGDTNDSKNNHWEVGGYEGGLAGKISANGSSWSAAGFDMFFYVADTDLARTFFSFYLDGAMYVVSKYDDGTTASKLYINGDRGKASNPVANGLGESGKAWVVNRWAGAFIKIVRGTGIGQVREIASNSENHITVTSNWTTTLDTTSEYIIYGTEWFTEIASTGLSVVSSTPIVANKIVYFPQGTTAIRWMIWNSTTAAHGFGNDAGALSFMTTSVDAASGVLIWGINHFGQYYYATAQAYSTSPAGNSYSGGSLFGDSSYLSTNIVEKDGIIYMLREDGVWTTTKTYINRLQSGVDKTPSRFNGAAVIAHQQFIYYSWMHSLIRIYGSSHDDIGQDWSGWGLPDGREGYFSSLDAYTSLLIGAVNAGTGTSSVLGFDGVGWHELLRAYDSNKQVRMVKVQACPETRNRMWVDVGGDLVYQEMPLMKGSPRLDSGVRYMHEAVIESAAIDMGTASGLPKFVKELTVYCQNLGENCEIYVDYQVDDDVHTTNWTHATVLFEAPEATAFLGLNNIRKFAYRLRIVSKDNTTPVDIQGAIPNGYARSPYKMVWTLRCRADNAMSRGRLVKPDTLMRWLLDNARYPGRVEMRSQFELAHKFFVIIHPPRQFPYKPAQNGQAEEAVFTLVLEEA